VASVQDDLSGRKEDAPSAIDGTESAFDVRGEMERSFPKAPACFRGEHLRPGKWHAERWFRADAIGTGLPFGVVLEGEQGVSPWRTPPRSPQALGTARTISLDTLRELARRSRGVYLHPALDGRRVGRSRRVRQRRPRVRDSFEEPQLRCVADLTEGEAMNVKGLAQRARRREQGSEGRGVKPPATCAGEVRPEPKSKKRSRCVVLQDARERRASVCSTRLPQNG